MFRPPLPVDAAGLAAVDPEDYPDGTQFVVTDDGNKLWEVRGAVGTKALVRLGDRTLDDLTDVDTSGVTDGQAILYDSGNWVPGDVLTEAEADALYDPLGAAAAEVDSHEGEPDPHGQYLTQAEADALYDPTGTATSEVADHEGEDDPHAQYLTEAEAAAAGSLLLTVIPPTVDSIATTSGGPEVTFSSDWGIDADGPYYDDTGAASGEEAFVAYDPVSSSLVVVKLGV